MNTELNNDDIEILTKALEALEEKSTRDGMLVAMLGMAFSKNKEESSQFADEQMKQAERDTAAIKDVIILLKAKLIQMRDHSTVAAAAKFLKEMK